MSNPVLQAGFDLARPTLAPIVSPDTATGLLGSGPYQYKISFVTRFGETTTGPASAAVTPTTGSVLLTNIPIDAINNTRSRRIYRTGVNNALPFRLIATIEDDITTTFTDLASDGSLGAVEPNTNFAASIETERGWIQAARPIIHSADFTLTATGSDHASSAEITQFSEYVFVIVPALGNGVKMPPATADMAGMKLTIRNMDIANTLNIYTFDPAGIIDAGPGIPFVLPPQATEEFIVYDPMTWLKVGTGGSGGGGTVASFSAGSTGLTPVVPTIGAITLGGTVNVSNGGTGNSSLALGGILYGRGSLPVGISLAGPGQLLSSGGGSAPVWTGSIIYDGTTITGVPSPTSPSDIVNKSYVDAAGSNLNIHKSVRLGSTADLGATYNNGAAGVGATLTNAGPQTALTIDGIAAAVNDRILVNNQAIQTENGVYDVTDVGSGATNWVLTRSSDFDNSPPGEIQPGDFVFVEAGNTLASTGWTQTQVGTGPGQTIIVGTDTIRFTQFSGAGTYIAGTGIDITGNTISNTGVLSVTGGASGLTFSPSTGNAILNGGVLDVAYGGTGNATNTSANSTITDLSAIATYYPVFVDSPGSGSKPLDINSAALRFIITASSTSITLGNAIAIGTTGGNASALAPEAIAIGRSAGTGTIAAISNIMIGESAGNSSMIGTRNVGIGTSALSGNTTGQNNTAVGYQTLLFNIVGINNTAIGSNVLRSNTTGNNNTASGVGAMFANTNGSSNTAYGVNALQANTNGDANTAVGVSALSTNTTGTQNTATGYVALNSNTGSNNTGIGALALNANTTGDDNTAVGSTALNFNTFGTRNTASGAGALQFNTTGSNNTAFGFNAGIGIATGNRNTIIGSSANASAAISNVTIVGHGTTTVSAGDTLIGQGITSLADDAVAVGRGIIIGASGAASVVLGQGASSDITGGIALGQGAAATSTTNALAIVINTASVTSGTMGLTLNGTTRQIEMYTSLYATTTSSTTPLKLSSVSAKSQYVTGTLAQNIMLPVVNNPTLNNGFTMAISNKSTGTATIYSAGPINGLTTFAYTFPLTTITIDTIVGTFPASGTFLILTTTGLQSIVYTSFAAGVFTFASAGTGTALIGSVVSTIVTPVLAALPSTEYYFTCNDNTGLSTNGNVNGWYVSPLVSGLVLDNSAVIKYPTQPQNDGVWYGTGTRGFTVAGAVSIGNGARAQGSGSVSVGLNANAGTANHIAIGSGAVCSGGNAGTEHAIAIGAGANCLMNPTTFQRPIAIGLNATCNFGDVCIGGGATTTQGTVIGYGANAGSSSVTIGTSAVGASSSVVIGYGSASAAGSSVSIGFGATSAGGTGVSVGRSAASAGASAVAVGGSASASAASAVAIGPSVVSSAVNAITIGSSYTNNVANTMVVAPGGTETFRILNSTTGNYSYKLYKHTSGDTAVITNVTGGAGTVTYTSVNTFVAGQTVTITGIVLATVASLGSQVLPIATFATNTSPITAGFSPTGGSFTVTSTNGLQTITYTGLTASSFTGCTGGTGTVATLATCTATASQYNLTSVVIASATQTLFTVTNAAQGTYTSGGSATTVAQSVITLSAAVALGGYYEASFAGAIAMTMDTGANLDANAQLAGGLYVGQTFKCNVVASNAAGIITFAGAAGITLKGILTTNANASIELVFYRKGTALWDVTVSAVGGGNGVTSITGTANQITASAPTGAITLSIPAQFAIGTDAISIGAVGALAGNATNIPDTIMIGKFAGNSLAVGAVNNIGIGTSALTAATTGAQNTAVGRSSGISITTGVGNTLLGSGTNVGATVNNTVVVGYTSSATVNSGVAIGDNAICGGSRSIAIGTSVQTGSSNDCVFIGHNAANFNNSTGGFNVAIGSFSMRSLGSGQSNTAVGFHSLYTTSNGNDNTGIGLYAGRLNLSGNQNTALGSNALYVNSTSSDNTALGFTALTFCTGAQNTGVGSAALYNVSTGSNNVGMGYQAGLNITSGSGNVIIGQGSNGGASITNSIAIGQGANGGNGSGNIIIGASAGNLTISANQNVGLGQNVFQSLSVNGSNTAVGWECQKSASGANNTAVGASALKSSSNGFNSAFGAEALTASVVGVHNVAHGYQTLNTSVSASFNTAVGSLAGSTVTTGANLTLIGYNAQPTTPNTTNEITLGDANVLTVRSQGAFVTLSDARDKKNITPIKAGIDFVDKLKPVDFIWDMRDLGNGAGKKDIADNGLIAQDLKALQEETGIVIPGLVHEANPERLEVGYGKLLPVLIQAIKDLSKDNKLMKNQIEMIMKKLEM